EIPQTLAGRCCCTAGIAAAMPYPLEPPSSHWLDDHPAQPEQFAITVFRADRDRHDAGRIDLHDADVVMEEHQGFVLVEFTGQQAFETQRLSGDLDDPFAVFVRRG